SRLRRGRQRHGAASTNRRVSLRAQQADAIPSSNASSTFRTDRRQQDLRGVSRGREGEALVKLIWLGHFIPYPPRGGGHQRSYHLLRQASKSHEIVLVAFNRPRVDHEVLEEYRAALQPLCAEIEFWEMPFPWKGMRWWTGLFANTVQTLPYSCEVYRSPA